ncbi:MAG: ATP-binding cassette domain-containing protein [Candidatus Heimdallarchaeota archaeon]|nr:ATP-binding cassette domain-containing protein [Candidatus Heimdallarchaeota archaeon]
MNLENNDNQIHARNLTKKYQVGTIETVVLNQAELSVLNGEFLVILGPSGSGKTTLLNIIAGLDRATHGTIIFNFEDNFFNISKMTEEELTKFRRKYVGFCFQFYNLIPSLTALENVELSARMTNKKKAREYSYTFLKEVELEGKEHKFPGQLSGGEQQRVALARALAKYPKMIFADEPTGNLGAKQSKKIFEMMKNLCKSHGITFLIVTHDNELAEFASRKLYLRNGKIISSI